MVNETVHLFSYSVDRLFLWCAENDIMLSLNAKDTKYDYDNEIIYLENYDSVEETLYSLLHECGHHIIQNHDDYVVEYRDKVRPQSPTEYFCGFMREEENAWREGYELARNLDLHVDSEAYVKLADECLLAYTNAIKGS